MDKVVLGKYVKIKTGKLDANASEENGIYPFFTCARAISRINSYAFDCECVLVAGNGELNVKYYEGKFNAYQRTYVIESLNHQLLSTKYLYYFIDSYMEKLRNGAIGGVIKYIKLNHLTDIELPLPDFETQEKIVAILDKARSLIGKREQTIQKFDDLLRATFLDMFGDPVKNERKWNKKSLKQFGDIITGNTPPRAKKEFYNDNFIEWIKTNNIIKESLFLSQAEEHLSLKGYKVSRNVDKNALLVTCIAGSLSSIGRSAISDRKVAFNQQINAIVPNDEVSVYFLYWMIKISDEYIHSFATKGMKRLITKGVFEKIEFIKPDYNLQQDFEKVAINANNLLSKLIHSKSQLENIINGLSQSAFKGELEFNTAVDLEVFLENDYAYFKDNADKKAIQLLLDRLDKNELNENKFYEQDLYDKAKSFVFELLKEDKVVQVFDTKTDSIKLTIK